MRRHILPTEGEYVPYEEAEPAENAPTVVGALAKVAVAVVVAVAEVAAAGLMAAAGAAADSSQRARKRQRWRALSEDAARDNYGRGAQTTPCDNSAKVCRGGSGNVTVIVNVQNNVENG